MAKPRQDQLERINRLVLEGQLTAEDVEVLQYRMVDANKTFYNTQFDIRTLRKFSRDVEQGKVALIELHRSSSMLPHGRSFSATLQPNGDLSGQFFVPIKDAMGNVRQDRLSFISGYKDGTVFDVSVGVHNTVYECNICGYDVRTMDCRHFPGREYNVAGENEVPKMVECIALCKGKVIERDEAGNEYFADCGCSELSHVVDGAVERARTQPVSFSKDGEDEVVEFAGGGRLKKGDMSSLNLTFSATMERVQVESLSREELDKIQEAELQKAIEELNTANAALQAEIETLKAATVDVNASPEYQAALADLQQFKAALVEIVQKNYIKTQGNKYNADTDRERLMALSFDDLSKVLEETAQAVSALPHGRQTPQKPTDQQTPAIDPSIYASNIKPRLL